MATLDQLPSHDADGNLRVVIETPRGATTKLKYDPELGVFVHSRALTLGLSYPYDWGFVPSTRAEDGDPLDVMVVHDATSFPGVVIACRPLALLLVTQRKAGGNPDQRVRNDRVIAVPARDQRLARQTRLDERVKAELERFFEAAVWFSEKEARMEGWLEQELDAHIRTLLR